MPDQPKLLSAVLVDELKAIKGRGKDKIVKDGTDQVVAFPAEGHDQDGEPGRRKEIYRAAHKLDLSALCLSGGGIRSAAISLGLIQALADRGLLDKFHYLSTVSGGGYIGSWLSAWLSRCGAHDVLKALRSRRGNSDREPAPIMHLRWYSNYLTPSVGLFSADTWTAFVIVMRNILINWLILLPALTILICAVKLLALGVEHADDNWVFTGSVLCFVFGGLSFGYKLYHLYSRRAARAKAHSVSAQSSFIRGSLLWAALAGLCFTWLALQGKTPGDVLGGCVPGWLDPASALGPGEAKLVPTIHFALTVYVVAIVYAACRSVLGWWLRAADPSLPPRPTLLQLFRDFACWAAGVLLFAAVVWLWTRLVPVADRSFPLALPGSWHHPGSAVYLYGRQLVVIFGLPCFLLATLLAHTLYLLLNSGSRMGDVEREWLGRAGGWHFIVMIAWVALTVIVLLGPIAFHLFEQWLGGALSKWLGGGVTGVLGGVTAFLGKSGLTPAQGKSEGRAAVSATLALAIVGPLFAVLLLILLSTAVGRGAPAVDWGYGFASGVGTILAGAVVVLGLADGLANINAFSLHAIYRNRLVRAFLGGARAPERNPDGFTEFDWNDDLRVAQLGFQTPAVDADWRPFHILNMTLNVSATRDLAWQQRKAMPFTVSPLHCGSAELGYRPTCEYGGPYGGMSLGTAMAISGAAVSSNMGYYSSKPLSFLLTFFNVRLGCWLGNPGEGGGARRHGLGDPPYRRFGPRFAVRPLLNELFGVTSCADAYVNLSDGGHFEDLGLFEMVRRRCRFIVVCDGDEDAERGFEDLGNAVRKIWIDLGVRITFENSALLMAGSDAKPADVPYFALGKIEYVSDAKDGEDESPAGQILYIKPVVRGDEAAADIIAYKRANDPFPDQSAADQWFDEPQLESYRHLGHLMTDELIESVAPNRVPVAKLEDLFSDLDRKARQARRKADAQPPVLVRSRFGYRAAWRGGT